MKKTIGCWISVLIFAALVGVPANAQPQATELAAAARIYGYDLAAGNWTSEQVSCSLMPDMALFHYRETFPDGTESRFTAVVPRAAGRIRIVPLLHHNATPFLPAPRDARNYALFNQLVRRSAAKGTWLDLSACYAALTGTGSGLRSELGIAGAPKPTVHVDAQGKSHRVTFATLESQSGYTVWSVSFDRFGRVTNAATEDESVYVAKAPPPVVHRGVRKRHERVAIVKPARKAHRESQERAAVMPIPPPPETSVRTSENLPQQPSTEEAGWKFIPTPPDPPLKLIPEPRQPRQAVLPNP